MSHDILKIPVDAIKRKIAISELASNEPIDLFRKFLSRFGMTHSADSDNDTAFISHLVKSVFQDTPHSEDWKSLCRIIGIDSKTATLADAEKATIEYEKGNRLIQRIAGNLPKNEAVYIGDGRIEIDGTTIKLTDRQKSVIEPLIEQRAMTLSELRRESSREDANKVISEVIKNHPKLSAFITKPGGKGKGGYSTTIIAR